MKSIYYFLLGVTLALGTLGITGLYKLPRDHRNYIDGCFDAKLNNIFHQFRNEKLKTCDELERENFK